MTDDWGDTPAFLAAVRDFEQTHPGVRVEVGLESIRNMASVVESQIAAGEPVDVAQWHAFAAGASGLAEPVDDLWASAGLEASEFFPGAMEDVTWGGSRYGVPLDTNALILLLRDANFESADLGGVTEFDSFEDMEQAARRLTSEDGERRSLAIPTSGWRSFGWIQANGGDLLEVAGDGSPRFTLDSPQTIGALEFLSSMIREGLAFAPVGANSAADSLALFRSGAAAMYPSGSWDFTILEEQMDSSDFTVAPMPAGRDGGGGSAMGGSSLFIPKGSEHRELAFEFMALLTGNPYALRLAREEGRLPARVEIFEDEFFQDTRYGVVREQLETARPLLLEAFPEAFEAYTSAVNAVLSGDADAAQAMHEAQLQAEKTQ